ncbi:MAG: translation initiation factor IF-2 subunit gamma [Candidatus Asgardarchaeia archaeon]
MSEEYPLQSSVNIGTIGHVDHGKTTLVKALTGVWTDRYSEEIKRGISIKLGYAEAILRKCPNCPEPEAYTVSKKCPHCGSETEILRRVSFVDAPGHEILLATMISGAALMDGAILVIAANEECPQPQTREHFEAALIAGVDKMIIVQNKVELVPKEKAIENYEQIKNFIKGSGLENSPIIPMSAIFGANLDVLIKAIEEFIPTPERDPKKPARMYIARSFDVNKPGTPVKDLVGGVVGGSIVQGVIRVGDEVEIKPGIRASKDAPHEPLFTEVVSLKTGLGNELEVAKPGGLIGVGTKLDPYLTKADRLVGQLLGKPGTLPDTLYELDMEVHLLERVVEKITSGEERKIYRGDKLLVNVGTATTIGLVRNIKKDEVDMKLSIPVCAEIGSKAAISKKIKGRWRLIGYGIIKSG